MPNPGAWYDRNAHCDYHSGTEWHSTENCWRLKLAVQELVKSGKLSFENVAPANPLPNHGGNQVGVIEKCETVKSRIQEVLTPMATVYRALVKADMIIPGEFGGEEME